MALHKHAAAGATQTLLTTELNSLANGAASAASTVFANSSSGNRYTVALLELYCTFGTAPTDGKTVDLYVLYSNNGTEFADGGGSVKPRASSYVGSFDVRNVNTAQRLYLTVQLMVGADFKLVLVNNAGQTMASSGNTLEMTPYAMETL